MISSWKTTGNGLNPCQYVGHYQVETLLDRETARAACVAHDTRENREVELRFPHEEIGYDVLAYEYLQREVRIGQMLTHPNIQKLYGLEEIDGETCLVLEYAPGQTLRDILHGPLEADTMVQLGIQIAWALHYAHEQGVVHRNLKPENILVTAKGQAKVTNFGIALLQGARRMTWGMLSPRLGCPEYMAPEQTQGLRGDRRTDIYALGMILYEGLAGRLPYEDGDALSVMAQHVNAEPHPLRFYRPDIAPALAETILKAIRRRREERWPTMRALVEALANPAQVDIDAMRAERRRYANHRRIRLADLVSIGRPL
jgi:serine/threonine protein kinase